jgi:cytochrome c-type biogenesis protein CcmE
MKPLHIILILIAGIAIAAVVGMWDNTSRYVSFQEADELAKENSTKNYHVVCKLSKAKPIQYDPQKDPNHLVFYAIDSLGVEKRIEFGQPKPQDLERSEKIVLNGRSMGDFFYAETILSKCPSKYEDAPVKEHPENIPRN